ncbi:MAG: GNAT family N-acetyltransferase [Telluria sp.]
MNDSTCHIRAMRSADLDAILGVQAACYPAPMQEPAAVVRARILAAGDTCAVAEDAEGVCAYLFGYPSRLGAVTPLDGHFEVASDADALYLHDLAVAPRALGRGLARALVGRLLEAGRRRGLPASALVSVQDTAAFWSALGYRASQPAGPDARAALASYPGGAQYMTRST